MYCVPPEDSGLFLARYAGALVSGENLFLVEFRTQPFRMFLDIDILDSEPWKFTDDKFQNFLKIIQKEVRTCFPHTNLQLIVTSAPLKYNKTNVKSCFHFYWPHLWVNDTSALVLRARMVEKLEEILPPLLFNSWQEVVDVAVFTGNGLRMFGSLKMAHKCPECNGRGGSQCPGRCVGGLDTNAARPYVLEAIYTEDLQLMEMETHRFREVTMCRQDADALYEFMKMVSIRGSPGQIAEELSTK